MDAARWIGIDVAKRTLDLVSLPEVRHWSVPNDAAGWRTLCQDLAAAVPAGIVLEATGSYHHGVTLALAGAGMPATVLNPAWSKAFGASEGLRKKTDRSDAHLLARYGQQKQPAPTPLRSHAQRQLTALLGRREDLVKMQVMEKNRRQVTTEPVVSASIDAVLAVYATQIVALDAAIERLIAAAPDLADRQRIVQSMPGVGPVTSAWLLGHLTELGTLAPKPLAALAGLAPHPRDSGARHGRRTIRGGRAAIRKALYQAATTAIRWNPVIRDYYVHLRTEQGCAHKVAVIACAHKMLRILSAMVREGVLWTETTAYRAGTTSPTALT